MSVASQKARPASRIPRQERGRARVNELLNAAEAIIGDGGYEAATMTAIADRAGAAIGSLYQFFPTKEALADTLRGRLNDGLCSELTALAAAAGRTPRAVAAALFEVVLGFMHRHPALMAIAD